MNFFEFFEKIILLKIIFLKKIIFFYFFCELLAIGFAGFSNFIFLTYGI